MLAFLSALFGAGFAERTLAVWANVAMNRTRMSVFTMRLFGTSHIYGMWNRIKVFRSNTWWIATKMIEFQISGANTKFVGPPVSQVMPISPKAPVSAAIQCPKPNPAVFCEINLQPKLNSAVEKGELGSSSPSPLLMMSLAPATSCVRPIATFDATFRLHREHILSDVMRPAAITVWAL